MILLSTLTLDRRLQPRETMDSMLVAEYAEAMLQGDVFPPIKVVTDGTNQWLVDGWHRVFAARESKIVELPAVIVEGTFDDAEDHSLTVNRDHGKRRTQVDVQNAIRRALLTARWVERSDAWIGRHIGCSEHTVRTRRKELETASQIAKVDPLLGEDGKWYPRQRTPEAFVIADHYTLDQWEALSKTHQRSALKFDPRENVGFNKQDNDSIEWARWSWNPVTGCKHNCPYCYARDIAERFTGSAAYPHGFEPVFHPKRLHIQRLLPPHEAEHDLGYKNVFVCSMADLFGRWVPDAWIDAVLKSVAETPSWNFLFLTKFPVRLSAFTFPDNAWVGTTVDCQARVRNAEEAFANVRAKVKWLSCEPLIEPLTFQNLSVFQWVVIGGASVSSQTPAWRPPRAWVDDLTRAAWAAGCQVYEKDNLLRRWRQYPEHPDTPVSVAPVPFHYLKKVLAPDEEVETIPLTTLPLMS